MTTWKGWAKFAKIGRCWNFFRGWLQFGMTVPRLDEADELVEVTIFFDYTYQKVPTRSNRAIQMRQSGTVVNMTMHKSSMNAEGVPAPRALWYAERMFLTAWREKHLPDVRMVHWQSRLKGSQKILSEYRVLLPADHD